MDTITSGLTWGLDGKVIICFCIFLLVTHFGACMCCKWKKQIPQS